MNADDAQFGESAKSGQILFSPHTATSNKGSFRPA